MRLYRTFLIPLSALLLSSCNSDNGKYDASGIFETTDVIVSAEVAGQIMELNIEEGQPVKQNASMGYIDTAQLWLKKKQLAFNLSATDNKALDINKQIAALRQQIKVEKQERNRYQKLVAADAAPQKQLDDIDNKIAILEQQVVGLQDQVSSANRSLSEQSLSISAQIAQIDDQISNSIICSPIDGIVTEKYAELGEYAVPGKALIKIADIGNMKLRAYVTAPQLTQLKIGQKVKVYADYGENDRKEYDGVISWISTKAEFTPKTIQTRDERANLVYAIKIAVLNDGIIKQGMYGDVKF